MADPVAFGVADRAVVPGDAGDPPDRGVLVELLVELVVDGDEVGVLVAHRGGDADAGRSALGGTGEGAAAGHRLEDLDVAFDVIAGGVGEGAAAFLGLEADRHFHHDRLIAREHRQAGALGARHDVDHGVAADDAGAFVAGQHAEGQLRAKGAGDDQARVLLEVLVAGADRVQAEHVLDEVHLPAGGADLADGVHLLRGADDRVAREALVAADLDGEDVDEALAVS